MSARIEGIYAILPPDRPLEETLLLARAALEGGIRIIQLRDKESTGQREEKAKALGDLVASYQGIFIVNDDLALARKVRADGVHLGKEDLSKSIAALRAEVGRSWIIGVSCQADALFAQQAWQEGASYLSFGAVFASHTKPERAPIGLARLAKARQMFPRAHIVAIGGIDLRNIALVRRAGADAAAICAGLFAADDVQATARRLVAAWEQAA